MLATLVNLDTLTQMFTGTRENLRALIVEMAPEATHTIARTGLRIADILRHYLPSDVRATTKIVVETTSENTITG